MSELRRPTRPRKASPNSPSPAALGVVKVGPDFADEYPDGDPAAAEVYATLNAAIVRTGLLILAIGDLIVGVFLRYVMVPVTDWLDLDPINFFWVEEVGEYSLAWLTMIGAGIGIAERAHFTLHVVTHHLPLYSWFRDGLVTIERKSAIFSRGVFTRFPYQVNTDGLPPEVISENLIGFIEAHYGEKGRELTPEQKAFNSQLSKERVVVEHTISRMKKFRVMADEFRNRLRHYDAMTNIVSGLVNLRILGKMNV